MQFEITDINGINHSFDTSGKWSAFLNADCMTALKQMPDKCVDLCIVDPPYGIGITESGRLGKYNANKNKWDKNVPDQTYFNELIRVSQNQIIWGGNYFKLDPCRCFLIWDKKQPQEVTFASCEFAWTSFNASAKTFYYSALKQEDTRIHPTQKPVALYEWLLKNYAKPGDKILDTHVGSASSLIACYNMGFDYMGFEIDKDYHRMATERLEAVRAQMRLY